MKILNLKEEPSLSFSQTAQRILKLSLILGAAVSVSAFAEDASLGKLAENLSGSFEGIAKLMIGTAYVAGIGFGISAIFKFKQHKDNPTQVPIGTPFALLAISVLLVFLPNIYAPAGTSIFGGDVQSKAGGTKGTGLSAMPGGGDAGDAGAASGN
ncbi:MAG: type IV secretion protein IcmD [Legionellales bacterium]|nr:type IV secretion protein IcmD [Legionellales bacterium]|tara:strand:+ start:645 stop:1109 length:465 start_codon:yes stop_codon:yes gene_type:complete